MLSALKNYPQFIVWKAVQYEGEPKPRKVPISYVTGHECSAHDATNWLTYEDAVARAPLVHGTGVGFVLTPLDPIACIDLDACLLDNKTWSPFATQMMEWFAGAAVELSYSGNGLHLWFQYDLNQIPANHKTRSKDVPGLEVYTSNRFIALGSEVYHGSSLTDGTVPLLHTFTHYLPGTTSEAADWSDTPVPEWSGPEDDGELIQKMLASRQSAASAFGGKASLVDLWGCNEEKLAETYPSESGDVFDRSAADAALFSYLAFWTGKNCERMDRLFRMSELVRQKYLDRPDYRQNSITQACGWTTNVYNSEGYQQVPGSDPTFPTQPKGIQFLTLLDLKNQPPPQWLIDEMLPEKGIATIAGSSGHMKTFLAVTLGLSIATGKNIGEHGVKKCGVIYMLNEGQAGIGPRCDAWVRHYNVGDIENFRVVKTTPNLMRRQEVETYIQAIRELGIKPGLIILDTFNKSTIGADDNSTQEMAEALEAAFQIGNECNALVLLIDHLGKDKSRGIRGSYSKFANADMVGLVTKSGLTVSLLTEKQRDGEDNIRFDFRIIEGDVPVLTPMQGQKITQGQFIKSQLVFGGSMDRQVLLDRFVQEYGEGARNSFKGVLSRMKKHGDLIDTDGAISLNP
jgi:hypothetical protein